MGLRADPDVRRKSRPHRVSNPDRKARSESPYRLSYGGRTKIGKTHKSLDSDRISHFERLVGINVRLLFSLQLLQYDVKQFLHIFVHRQ